MTNDKLRALAEAAREHLWVDHGAENCSLVDFEQAAGPERVIALLDEINLLEDVNAELGARLRAVQDAALADTAPRRPIHKQGDPGYRGAYVPTPEEIAALASVKGGEA